MDGSPGWTSRIWGAVMGPDAGVEDQWGEYSMVYAWFLGLQLLDLLTTSTVLFLGGAEGNPVGAASLDAYGIGGLVLLKLGLLAMTSVLWTPAIAFLARRRHTLPRGASATVIGMLAGLGVFYSIIVYHNLVNIQILVLAAP